MPGKMKELLPNLAAFAGAVAGLFHGFAQSPPPRPGGTLHLAFGCRTLDPARVFLNHEATLARMLFNNLLDRSADGELIPDLAEALPHVSDDGLTYTFRLRRGVRFSNGKELTADDVVFSFERFFDPTTASPTAPYFSGIAGGIEFRQAREQEYQSSGNTNGPSKRWIEPKNVEGLRARDSHTVEIRLNQPDLMFTAILTGPMAAVVPRSAPEVMSEFGRHPIGTGPFVLQRWVPGLQLHLARNPHYFRENRPYIDAVEVVEPMPAGTQVMMFERSELDLVTELEDSDYLRIRRNSTLASSFRRVEGNQGIYVALNCELPPFTNRLVRIALNHAVDRDRLARALLARAIPSRGVLPMSVRGFNPDLPEYAYNPARAKALLAQAGLSNGFEATMIYPRDGAAWKKAALVLQQDLREIGVRLELKELSYGAVMELSQRRRTTQMTLFDVAATVDDPKDQLDLLLNGDNITDEACQNAAFYSNPSLQMLFRTAAVERNPAERLRLYQDIERRIVEDAPWIFLCHLNAEMLCQSRLKGLTLRGFWPPVRLEGCWIEP